MSDLHPVPTNSGKKKSIYVINIILVLGLLAAIAWGISTYFDLDKDVYTNDAQVEEYINPVNSRIPGYVKEVYFEEHQAVKKGDTLVLIDDNEYKIALEQAAAAYLSALAAKVVTRSTVSTVGSNIEVSNANIAAAKARLWNAEKNYHRYVSLVKEGAATQQQLDQVQAEYEALKAQTSALEEQRHTASLSTAEAGKRVTVNEAEIKRTHALVDMAKLNLSYTVIRAPYNGVTGRRQIQEGQLVQAGQTMLSFVRDNIKWIVANYKETQLGRLKIGQKVRLNVDGLEGREIHGVIEAISGATGSRYSAVPVDNSTGNFVKVQQRIPVKIRLLEEGQSSRDAIAQLRAGMNVQVRLAH